MSTDTIFHCLDILSSDEIILEQNEQLTGAQLVIKLFGRTPNDKPVSINVEGYKPYFYIAAPQLPIAQLRTAQRQLADFLDRKGCRDVALSLEFREKFYGFTNHQNFPFFRLTVNTMKGFHRLKRIFLNEHSEPAATGIGSSWSSKPQVFEANIDPMLRFLHERDLQPCGWMQCRIPVGEGLHCRPEDLSPAVAPAAAAPFAEISWDLECFSESGFFPQAKKDYARTAKEICMHATDGTDAVELVACALSISDGHSTLTRIQTKNRKSPDAADIYDRIMRRPTITDGITKVLDLYRRAKDAESREQIIENFTTTLNQLLGARFAQAGDPCIQIGNVVAVGGKATERHVFVWPSCAPIDGVVVHESADETTMWQKWFAWIETRNPDIMMGYNTSNFDERYVWNRAEELGLTADPSFQAFNRLGNEMKLLEQRLSSSALGDNLLYMLDMQGRVSVDLFSFIKARDKLDSYKLDSVAKHYMSGSLVHCDPGIEGTATLRVKGAIADCQVGRSIVLLDEDGDTATEKLQIMAVSSDGLLTVRVPLANQETWDEDICVSARRWVIVKDDIGPADIFRLHKGSAADRAIVAKYCVQDCDLVLELYKKLEVFVNSMAMANVCSVPMRYIYTRGQGIKIESLIFKECAALNKCILTLSQPIRAEIENSYDGAIVLDPEPGLYNRSPIGVGDFASLYPSSIVSENISHDTLLWSKDYDLEGNYVRKSYGSEVDAETEAAVPWTDIKFDIKVSDPHDKSKNPKKVVVGFRVCRYAQDRPGALPIIIKKLLAARNAKKKEMGRETNAQRKVLLDGEQLAYKLTANALYGQLGSSTFKVRLQDLAASTTAYGRLQIMYAKEIIEQFYGPAATNPRCAARIIYGDTDSLFIEWNPKGEDGQPLEGRAAREAAIKLTEESGDLVSQSLKAPHYFEFDKVYHPFLIFTKKRYAGHLYESNPDDFYPMYMGIALRRRDSAAIVKVIYGKAMTEVLTTGNLTAAIRHVQEGVDALVSGRVKMALLTISQQLKAEYANPKSIAHKALADRMAARDPGTAPVPGDRVPYVFVKTAGPASKKKKADIIESPAFVVAKGLEIDAGYYISKQLEKPISQMFGVLLEQMPGFTHDMLPSVETDDGHGFDVWLKRRDLTVDELEEDPRRLAALEDQYNESIEDRATERRSAVAARLLFGPALKKIESVGKRAGIERLFGGKAHMHVPSVLIQKTPKEDVPKPVSKRVQQSRLTNFIINKQILEIGTRRKSRSRESSISAGSKGSTKK